MVVGSAYVGRVMGEVYMGATFKWGREAMCAFGAQWVQRHPRQHIGPKMR